MTTTRAFPDTPVAMHYRPFQEIDWPKLLATDDVILVVTAVLLREIDAHKDHKRGTLQKRARRVSGWLGELRKTKNWTIRPGVRVEVNAEEPGVEIFDEHGLERAVNDDRIIACMLRDRIDNPETTIVCVTSDNALAYKAESAGFAVVEPPENMRLAEELDSAERENRELRQKIVDLQNRIDPSPDLAVHFAGGEDRLTVSLSGLDAPLEHEVDSTIEAERVEIELGHSIRAAILRPPSPQAIDGYLKELREWMVKNNRTAQETAHTFDLQLVLANAGRGNATDIEVDLVFPQTVFVSERRSTLEVVPRPKPPEPRSLISSYMPLSVFPMVDLAKLARPRIYEPVRIEVDPAHPHRMRVLVDRAKHQRVVELPRFQAWFEVGRCVTGFGINYRIHAGSTPDIQEGTLHVKVETGEGLS